MDSKCGEGMERVSQYCCEVGTGSGSDRASTLDTRWSMTRPGRYRSGSDFIFYLPLKINQSPCDVPMNKSIGKDIQALVREATNAWRASSGAAGGPPVIAPIIRLLFGQMMPQTFSNITMP